MWSDFLGIIHTILFACHTIKRSRQSVHNLIRDFSIKFPDLKDVAVCETLRTFKDFKIAPPIIGYFFVEFKSDPEFKKLEILFTHFNDISNALKYNDNNFEQLLDTIYDKHVSSNRIKKMVASLINFFYAIRCHFEFRNRITRKNNA